MTPFRALCVVGFLGTAGFAQFSPPTPAEESRLFYRGRVRAAGSLAPLPRARVSFTTEGAAAEAILTDDEGRFSIGLPRATGLLLTVTKAGYGGTTVRVSRDEVSSGDVGDVRLELGAAVSGRIVDSSGQAVVATPVFVRPVANKGGERSAALAPRVSETDDRGEFRVGSLPAGQYVVTVAGSRKPAAEIQVKPGDDVGGINLVLDAPGRARSAEGRSGDSGREHGTGTAVLQGRVLGDSGEPLPGARLRLLRHGMNVRTATADAVGRYAMHGVPAGRFTLRAANPGYVTIEYGQRTATETGTTLHVRDDDTLRGLEFTLPRGSGVMGNVVDEHGEPLEGALVRALQLRFMSGRMIAVSVPGVRERRTDDRGHYRLFGLLPGKYLVSAWIDAAVSNGRQSKGHGYAPSYYPGTADVAAAWRVQVEVDRDVFGAHIVLAPSPAVRISGVVFDSSGKQGLKGLVLLTAPQRSRMVGAEARTAELNGTFLLTNVPPGEYVIQAVESSESGEVREFAAQYVRVQDADLSLTLTTSPGATMDGRVVVEGDSGGEPVAYSIRSFPVDFDRAPIIGSGPMLDLDPNGRFGLSGLYGLTRFVLVGAPPHFYLKSVIINGRDATDVPYDFGFMRSWHADGRFIVSPNAGVVQGRATDDRSVPVSEYTVVAFPVDRTKWFAHSRYLKFARPSQDDSFEVAGLPPGEYWVTATATLDATDGGGEWQNPEVLERLATGAERVTLSEGAVANLTLRLR